MFIRKRNYNKAQSRIKLFFQSNGHSVERRREEKLVKEEEKKRSVGVDGGGKRGRGKGD
jgi:hypothetical protein